MSVNLFNNLDLIIQKKENFNIESQDVKKTIESIEGLDACFFTVEQRAKINKNSDPAIKELHEKVMTLYRKAIENLSYVTEQIQEKINQNEHKYENLLVYTLSVQDHLHSYVKHMNDTLLTIRPTIKIEYGERCIDPLMTHSNEPKIQQLLSNYKALRKIRGDGNCFLYSFTTRLLETYTNQGRLDKFIEQIDNDQLENSSLEQFKPTLSLLKKEIKETLLDLKENPSKIEEILKENHKILPLTNYFRILAADEIMIKKDQFEEPFKFEVEDTFKKDSNKTHEQLISDYVLRMGVDFIHSSILALCQRLSFCVKILDPKLGAKEGLNVLDNQQPQATFYRDGEHYVVLYTADEIKTLNLSPITKISISLNFDKNQYHLGICGSGIKGAKDWDEKEPICLYEENNIWTTSIQKEEESEQIAFKYVLIDKKTHAVRWENHANRTLNDSRTPEF